MERQTYHLYHHHDPLPLEDVRDQAWLLNSARHYSLAAQISAPCEQGALQAAREKARALALSNRRAVIQEGSVLRETLPGDVLVAAYAAWMVDSAGALRLMPYAVSACWKQLRQFAGQPAIVNCLARHPSIGRSWS